MTAGDLIQLLSSYPPDLRVIIRGYEGGYTDIHAIIPKQIALDKNDEWYYGPHDDIDTVDPLDPSYQTELAIHLSK